MVYRVTNQRLRPLNQIEICDRLGEIGVRLGWLKPSSHNPHQYHEQKSELLRDIGKLRQQVRLGTRD